YQQRMPDRGRPVIEPLESERELVSGRRRFLDDLPLGEGLIAAFVRSPLAHAGIRMINLKPAEEVPGVVAADHAQSLVLPPRLAFALLPEAFARPPLARDVVRFAGEAVAVVVASSRSAAADGAEAVRVEYDPWPCLVDAEQAEAASAPILFPTQGSNRAFEVAFGEEGDLFADCEVVVQGRLVNQRLAPVPLEANAVLAEPDGSGGLLVYASTQSPFQVRDFIADSLGLAESSVRCVTPSVGGAFGGKLQVYPEQVVVAALALRLQRPVRWVESRSENLVAMTHGRAQIHHFKLGASRNGAIQALSVEILADAGAYPGQGAFLPLITGQMLSGVYAIPRIHLWARSVCTNTTPTASYRGAGRPEATMLIEGALDLLAAELGLDPIAVRRTNLIPKHHFPHTTATGVVYDSGDYERALADLLQHADYPRLRAEQSARRARGDHLGLGIGICLYVEMTAIGSATEYASARLLEDGRIAVAIGTADAGQGHAAAFAALAATALEVKAEQVVVVEGDTSRLPRGDGTSSSRSIQLGGSAVQVACHALWEQARAEAAVILDERAELLLAVPGGFAEPSARARTVTWQELAASGHQLFAQTDLVAESTFPFGAHLSVVEVDLDTGAVELLRHVTVDDCGTLIDPRRAQAQVHGGVAQGVAQALAEEVLYDPQGTPLTSTLLDYAVPGACELPDIESHSLETPTASNPLGSKGIGEAGAIGSTPSVVSAVLDALRPHRVRGLAMPLTAERIWRALQQPAPPESS
ncbi:MAG: xanthine dehydrogenase family protein molybdopterin-binding subunit, partial [Candidatus Dormibacteraceae bacterium]